MDRADCNECLHACVCKHKDDAQEELEFHLKSPIKTIGEVDHCVAVIKTDAWLECDYFRINITEETKYCI